MSDWAKRNPERARDYARRYYAKPENRERKRAYARQWYRNHPKAHHQHDVKYNLKHKYGITPDDVATMREKQGGRCALCREARRLEVEHDHLTGKVRGLTCHRCNLAIGFAESVGLDALAKYLVREQD